MIRSTDAGQAQIDREMASASEEVVRMNSKAAVQIAETTRQELTDRILRLETIVKVLTQRCDELNSKYNLLLTERFSTGPTVR